MGCKCSVQININFSQTCVLHFQNEIRSSLVLSMLQQMLSDDKTEEVREAVVRSLGLLMGFIDDPDKYDKVNKVYKCGPP